MSEAPLYEEPTAETDAAGVFRVCPCCRHVFATEAQWKAATVPSGTEKREKRYTDYLGQLREGHFELEVRKHGCGGENYSRGRLLYTRTVPS